MDDDLGDRTWALARFEGFKAHLCHVDLLGDLVADIGTRGGAVKGVESVSEGAIDLPGMVAANRPWEEVRIGDFVLHIPSQDFAHFLGELSNAPTRRFASGKPYHKIHGWLVCVVLAPEQRAKALRAMGDLLPEAARRGEEAESEMEEALARINRDREFVVRPRLTHVPVPPDRKSVV